MLASHHLDRLDQMSINLSDDNSQSNSNTRSGSDRSGSLGIDSSLSDSNATGTTREKAEAEILADKVSKQVFWLKMTVLLVLLAATILVSVAIYLSTMRSEIATFEAATQDHISKILDSVKFNMERKLGAIDGFSVAITSLALDLNVTWPLINVPDFEFRAANARELADATSVALLPLVTAKTRAAWESFSIQNTNWISDGQLFEKSLGGYSTAEHRHRGRILKEKGEENSNAVAKERRELQEDGTHGENRPVEINGISSEIFELSEDGYKLQEGVHDVYFPMWEHAPVVPDLVNYDLFTDPNFHDGIQAMITSRHAVLGKIWDLNEEGVSTEFLKSWETQSALHEEDPVSKMFYPVYDTLEEDHILVGLLATVIHWQSYLNQILPPHADGLIVVLSNSCNQTVTYQVNGETSEFLGVGDLHDPYYNRLGETIEFAKLIQNDDKRVERFADVIFNVDFCPYTVSVYPSELLESAFVTNNALIYTICVVVIFAFTALVFLVYDWIVERRQKMVMKRAVQSRAIVSSLFPAAVRDRLFKNDDSTSRGSKGGVGNKGGGIDDNGIENKARGFKKKGDTAKNRLKNLLNDPAGNNNTAEESKPVHELRPIADLFPHTTVMFADIAGFTRWSSDRDPAHVFTLLQTVYHAFDRIAKKRGVFKVETIGDCYVAVTGLPDPQRDHAVRMAKFAHECMKKMSELVLKLKETLGEDTAELCMRFGLHSGPVTAGVLRGEKSRFQLFGNTVNTAARMENTGQRMKIQCSQETADLITEAGKGHWIYQRIDDIASRGGIQTYWVEPQSKEQEAKLKNAAPTRVTAKPGPVTNSNRLVDWNVDILKRLLKRVVAYRRDEQLAGIAAKGKVSPDFAVKVEEGKTVRDEVAETIELPKYRKDIVKTDPEAIDLGEKVDMELRDFVSTIESLYHDNPFHSFKHASNVCTNAHKMLTSIVDGEMGERTANPLTQFAVVFSALIHDVDHAGISNMQLIKEKPNIAHLYRNKSVAEQNSVDLAWNLLMDPSYEALQDTIFSNNEEFKRFRNIVVNVVMATDIFDKDLNADRTSRWLAAFDVDARTEQMDAETEANLKATLIVEHSMQISDIMHCVQHFHSYARWNERLFEEMYGAFDAGRTRKDPSIDWYQGEIWFFDNCVIPLAQRIKDVGVFGVQGEDCLRNAISNKKEWTIKGNDIVKELVRKYFENKAIAEAKAAKGEENNTDSQEEKAEKEKEAVEKVSKESRDKHMVEWNVDLCKRMLRQILAHRMASGQDTLEGMKLIAKSLKEGSTVRDEVVRIIDFPDFDKKASKLAVDPEAISLSKSVEDQLRDYVTFIASMYRDIPFHNFKHASNVSMSANKYIQRIADDALRRQMDHPLAQFAIIFSALVHDVDHTGVPNALLVKEKQKAALLYKNKSVAEQNSIDLAWTVLMDAGYKDLQGAIYSNQEEFDLFRSTIINAVMATDLFDEELIADRNKRWAEAFDPSQRDHSLSDQEYKNLRATIVMEHVMQVSDIGHTMQHFHSFRRWNERLFQETYKAFEEGRIDNDPSKNWYEGEIKFFDTYVCPLAQKLKDCAMFGSAGEDALECALSNRKEWVINGVAIVQEFVQRYHDSKDNQMQE